MRLNVVRCSLPIFEQLEIEEALLRVGEGNWCLLNKNSPPAIVLGLSSSLETLVDLERVQKNPVPIIRRFSGGGTVVVDEETLFFTLILEKKTNPSNLMDWTGRLLASAFLPHELRLEEYDYAIQGKKIGGNAQSFCRGRALHHTSFLWSWQKERMDYLKHPGREPVYREGRSHADFCGKLELLFSTKEELFTKVLNSLAAEFVLEEVPLRDALRFCLKPHVKRLTYEREITHE